MRLLDQNELIIRKSSQSIQIYKHYSLYYFAYRRKSRILAYWEGEASHHSFAANYFAISYRQDDQGDLLADYNVTFIVAIISSMTYNNLKERHHKVGFLLLC